MCICMRHCVLRVEECFATDKAVAPPSTIFAPAASNSFCTLVFHTPSIYIYIYAYNQGQLYILLVITQSLRQTWDDS